ncbi:MULTISPECIES: hypothetical protein [Agathobacter]|uniref:hypothetical protein n=1 Tax=Agathobacter TaxID=1766253 RepID=UPI000AC5651F|nr:MULTISPECIES: hypothetical protein [Agathobacter]MBQ1681502.1 hypothetical protein [Agathobacter sp.]MCR5676776.1 hypothetical protein [Agathobacter sp.]MDC7301329.1 hypothetical protein [Agathobacter ruminis]
MKEIFQEYGGILITITAILAVLAVILVVVGTDGSGVVGKAFANLIEHFISTADSAAGM